MAGTVTAILTTVHDCDAVSDWTGTPTLDTEVYIQGTGSLSKKVSKTTSTHMKPITAVDLSDTIIYAWVMGSSIAQFDTKAGGGIRIRVEEGATPNWGEWYVAGSDEGYEGGWQCLAIRTTQAFSNQSTPAPDKTAVNAVGVVFGVVGSAAKINCWWDAIRYGTGLNIKGGTEAIPATFADIVTTEENVNNRWGVVVKTEGVLMVQGRLTFGSTTAGEATYFKDTSKILVFRDRAFGIFYELKVQGNGTATTKVYFGDKPVDRGISGCIFSCAGASKYKFIATDTNITNLGVYGCIFMDADTISLPAYSANKEVLNCTFEKCAEILPDTCIVKYCNFISADDRGLRITYYPDLNITDCNFINCPHCVHINFSDSVTFNNLKFSGSNGTDKWDIEHSVAGTLTILNTNGSNAEYVDETGGGSTNIETTVYLTIWVEDEDGDPVENAACYIEKASDQTELMNKLSDATGKAQETYNYGTGPDVDINIRVRKSSSGVTRYIPYRTTGTITSGGYTLTVVLIKDLIVV